MAPSQDASHHQDYDSFRPGDSYKPEGAVSKLKVAIFFWDF